MKPYIYKPTILSACLTFVSISCSLCLAKPIARITVHAGGRTRIDTPVSISLADIGAELPDIVYLEEVTDEGPRPVGYQPDPADPNRLCWLLHGKTLPGQTKSYLLTDQPSVFAKFSYVRAKKSDDFLDIEMPVFQKKILRYHHGVMLPPEGTSPLYARSAFIHPLWSPSGSVLTEIHPEDHIHHMGIWMPWTATAFEGRKVDFWNLGEGRGTVRFVKYLSTTTGPAFGGFRAAHHHVVLDPNKDDEVALNEIWDVRVYNLGGPKAGYWLLDLTSTQRCATDSPLYQLKYRYGGLGFRATSQWHDDNCDYLTSEGKTKIDGHATRARWCDMFGLIGDHHEGLTVISHPQNFRHPEPMRLWPPDMKYIFFNFCPSQIDNWKMEPGKDYVFKYRFYVHSGKIDVENVERLWYDFAEPPKVTVDILDD